MSSPHPQPVFSRLSVTWDVGQLFTLKALPVYIHESDKHALLALPIWGL